MTSRNKLSAAEVSDICRLYQQGASQVELATRFGVAQPTIRYHLLQNDVELRSSDCGNGKGKLTRSQIAEIVERYEKGQSQVELAEQFGVAQPTIRYHLLQNDVRLRPSGGGAGGVKLTDSQITEIVDLYARGWTQVELAACFGVAQPTIRYHLKRRGVKLRSSNGGRAKLSSSQIDALHRYRDKGMSKVGIGRILGVSDTAVSYHIAKRASR